MTNKPVLVATDIAIRDDAVRVEFADLLTELRYHDGHIAISFAHGIWDEGNPAEAVVCARLRIPLGAAQLWSKLLAKVVNDALQPHDPSKTN